MGVLFAVTLAIASLFATPSKVKGDDGTPHAIRVGVKECAACHTQPGLLYPKLGVTQFIRLTEAAEWFHKDKHAFAYELVRQDLSEDEWKMPNRISNRKTRSIIERLGWQLQDGRFEKQCLSCHAGLEVNDALTDPWVAENVTLGVQCEACHGPGSQYMRIDQHQQTAWRTRSPEAKSKLGMNDLTNPASCAQVCLSCHLGDVKKNRFVTHAMYAAGHPPLPPFELQTFLDAMPKHWVELEDKPIRNGGTESVSFEHQEAYYQMHLDVGTLASEEPLKVQYGRSMNGIQRSRVAMEMTRAESHRLLVDASTRPEVWGDYALFDCMGCHQLLTSTRPRFRPEGRIPGRAFPPLWLNSASNEATPKEPQRSEYAVMVDEGFTQVFNRRPFGDADQMRKLAEVFDGPSAHHTSRLIQEGRRLLPPAAARSWLAHWIQERRPMLGDYWVARHTGWIVMAGLNELARKQQWEEASARAVAEELTRLLHLDLQIPPQESVLKQQSSVLETAHEYDIEQVTAILDDVKSQLERP